MTTAASGNPARHRDDWLEELECALERWDSLPLGARSAVRLTLAGILDDPAISALEARRAGALLHARSERPARRRSE